MSNEINKPRALFIGPYPPPFAGVEMVTKMFLESSLKEDFDISFLNTNVRKSNAEKGTVGLTLVYAFFRFVFFLMYNIMRHRPRIAYYSVTATQLGWMGRDIWCIWICRLFRVRTVIHLQGSHFRLNYATFHPFSKHIIKWTCRHVSSAIVQAECLKGQFEGILPGDRITYLYQGIEPSEYDNPDLDNYQQGAILFIGHLTKAKGYIDLLRAMERVVENCPEAQFYFAGTIFKGERNVFFNQYTGERLTYEDPYIMRDKILSGPLKEHYHELGMLYGDDYLKRLQTADIMVLPSYSEGFSRAVLEAMSVGKPIIYTPVGAHAEALIHEENGFMSEPGDVNQLAENIIRLIHERDVRDRIARNNYEKVRTAFSIDIIAKRMSDIMQVCLT